MAFDYPTAPFAVRRDLSDAYRRTWEWIAGPGAWWTGAERVAIAAEVRAARACAVCRARKAALSPGAVQGAHDRADARLTEVAVDAVHRLVTDPVRLSRSWLEKAHADGVLSDGHYVELLGVAVFVVSIDGFHRALGWPLEPLPTPRAGETSGYRPPAATEGVGWVAMVPENGARGAEADLYAGRRVPNVLRAMSLVPDCVREMRHLAGAQYVPLHMLPDVRANASRALSRAQIELVAARVSAVNECFY